MPYAPVTGSRNMPRCGVTNVKHTNAIPIMQSRTADRRAYRQGEISLFKRRASKIYAAAAATKNIAMFAQSGDLPITPLYV